MPQSKPSLSLCMIVKNEQTYLAKYLPLSKAHCDEIIVVDTGSSDSTRKIAAEYGARVFDFEWQNDFSAARNFSLEKAAGEWILVLDADEAISPGDWRTLLEKIRQTDQDYFTLRALNYMWQENGVGFVKNTLEFGDYRNYPGYIEGWVIRLFRNRSHFRFSGPLHEALIRDGAPLTRNPLSVTIHNHGMALPEEKLLQKKKLYLQISIKKVKANENDFQANHEAGIAYFELNQIENAQALLKRAFRMNPRHIRNLMALGTAEQAIQRHDEAEKYFLLALALDPNTPFVHQALGLNYFHWGRIQLALEEFKKELSVNPDSKQAGLWLQKAGEALRKGS